MPIHKTITVDQDTKVWIWKIQESLKDLVAGVALSEDSIRRISGMKSEIHQCGFVSIRHLLKEAGYADEDVIYDEYGKPHLKDGKFISITHSFIYTGIIISNTQPVGIDIEKRRDKILRIAHKFTPLQEYRSIANHDALIEKLTIVWGAKESLYKIYGKKKLRFLQHIYIEDFSLHEDHTIGKIMYNGSTSSYAINFFEMDEFTCVFAYDRLN